MKQNIVSLSSSLSHHYHHHLIQPCQGYSFFEILINCNLNLWSSFAIINILLLLFLNTLLIFLSSCSLSLFPSHFITSRIWVIPSPYSLLIWLFLSLNQTCHLLSGELSSFFILFFGLLIDFTFMIQMKEFFIFKSSSKNNSQELNLNKGGRTFPETPQLLLAKHAHKSSLTVLQFIEVIRPGLVENITLRRRIKRKKRQDSIPLRQSLIRFRLCVFSEYSRQWTKTFSGFCITLHWVSWI